MNNTGNITTKDKIKQIASDLFNEFGYDNVSIQDICKKASVTKTTFYYHFPSKDALLDPYLAYPVVAPYDVLRLIFSLDSYWKQIWLLSDYAFSPIYEKGSDFLSQVLKSNLSHNINTFGPLNKDLLNISVPLMKKAQDSGEILNPANPETLIEYGWMLCLGNCSSWCIQNGDYDIRLEMLMALETLYNIAPEYQFTLEEIDAEIAKIN